MTLAEFKVQAELGDVVSFKELGDLRGQVSDRVDALFSANADITTFGSIEVWHASMDLVSAHQEYGYALPIC